MSDLLLNEPPVLIQAGLVRRLGMVEAAITQQLHYWSARATIVHEGERYVYKTYQDWSDEIGITAKQARGALDRLRSSGVVVGIQNPTDSRDRTLWWRIDHAVLEGGDTDPGARSAPEGSSGSPSGQLSTAPEGTSNAGASRGRTETTSETTVRETRERALSRPDQPKKFTHKGRKVTPELAASAARVLDVFNDVTGSTVKARKRNGDPTPDLKQVAGAMLDRDDVSEQEWAAGVRRMAECPPSWIEGEWIVGHMFGAKSSAHTVARAAPIAASAGGLAGGNVHRLRPSRGGTPWSAADMIALTRENG